MKNNFVVMIALVSILTVIHSGCDEQDTLFDSETSTETGAQARSIKPECVRYVNSEAEKSGDGESWETAVTSVSEAVALVSQDADSECEIWVKGESGNIEEKERVLQGVTGFQVYDGFSGTERSRRLERAASINEAVIGSSGEDERHGVVEQSDDATAVSGKLNTNLGGDSIDETYESGDGIPAIGTPLENDEAIPIAGSTSGYYRIYGQAPYLWLDDNSGTTGRWDMINRDGNLEFYRRSGSGNMRLARGGGNVGIGSTFADEALTIYERYAPVGIHVTVRSSETEAFLKLSDYDAISKEHFKISLDAATGDLHILSDDNNGASIMTFLHEGRVGIGTENPENKLDVVGTIRATKMIVESGWSDYVFEDDYRLMSLEKVEKYIQRNGHLPGIPSAKEVEKNGVSIGDTQAALLAKIEELTLHLIRQDKEIKKLTAMVENK